MKHAKALTVAVISAGVLGLVASPASAAATVTRSASCTNDAGSFTAAFSISNDSTRYGTLRAAQGIPRTLQVTAEPRFVVKVRDGAGRLVLSRTSGDGSMSLTFAKKVGGPGWTAQATVTNTADGACSTPKVRLAVR